MVEGLAVAVGVSAVVALADPVGVGDGEAVVVLPRHLAEEIAAEALEMTVFEDYVQEQVQKGRSIVGLYPATDAQVQADYAAWRAANRR